MALKNFTGTINFKYQGGTGATKTAAKNNKQTLKMSFTIDDELKKLANNIRIDSAKLYLTCSASGKSAAKQFTFSAGLSGAITSTGDAYNNTCFLNIGDGYGLRTYLANGGGNIWTYDNSSTYHDFNTTSGYYTENYCSISSARLEIQYTILQSTLTYTNPIVIGQSNEFTISAGSTSYRHNLTISIGGQSFPLLENVAGGTHSRTPSTDLAEKFTTTTSATATLTLETKDGSTSLGTNTYTNVIVSVNDSSGVSPDAKINSISTGNSKDGKPYAIAGSTAIYLNITGTAQAGATIKSYTLRVGNISYSYTLSEAKKTFTETKTIIAPSAGDVYFYFDIVDSRGLKDTYTSLIRHITNYVAPALKTGSQPLQRVNANGAADVKGKYYSFTYTGVDCCKILDFSTGATITNTATMSITIDGTESQITSSPWRSTRTYENVDKSYTATVKVKDLWTTTTYTFDAPSATYLLHFLDQTNSVGIGCAAEALADSETGKITMGWPVYLKGNANVSGDFTVSKKLTVQGELILPETKPLGVLYGGTGVGSYNSLAQKMGLDTLPSKVSDNAAKIKQNTDDLSEVCPIVEELQGYAHIKDIQMGMIYGNTIGTVSSGSCLDYTVTFPRTFFSAPFVICCFEMSTGTSPGDFGKCVVAVKNGTITTTQFTFSVFNGDSRPRAPRVRWLAIEMA